MYVLDSNIVVYFLKGLLRDPLPDDDYAVSVISEIELLSYQHLPPDDEQLIHEFLASVEVVGLVPEVRDVTIRLRRDHRLKIPDAIIVATAQVLDATLLTNDQRLVNIPSVRHRSLSLRSE